ncbi:MAG TPA: FecR domain-containing protein [Geobacteraceae bacterium]|nr:FecR domain-containing protein [Geobacteraceae bacterium]
MKKFSAIIAAAMLLASFSAFAADAPVGSIKAAHGTATIMRNTATIEAKNGARVFQNDLLKTGSDGTLAVVFRDDTLLSLGPDSTVAINEFLFSPAEGKLSIVTRLLRGTAAYMSGIIAKLAPDSVRFETPVASIGIRGTVFAAKVDNPSE